MREQPSTQGATTGAAPAATPRRLRSVLIANRGEIAVRIIAACQELGIRAIAVYSEADQTAAHVRAADVAVAIGAAPARASYLNSAAIIAAARATGAEAIHPGYGFLSENAAFAEDCAAAGLIFIGPPPEAIRLMGSKTAAKRAVEAHGVPTVPGYSGEARDLRTLQREAARIGYPIMLKAAAGGGGRGMRVVQTAAELSEAVAAARREALAAFGDESIFLEKLIVAPRHIEFQVLADRYGNVVHLGERECSIQRRHQKVIEESPSSALSPDVRAAMGAAAVSAARAAGYVNAGTCEFLLDESGAFYFLEMNTRLQVEHPVTELVSGLDLVHHQLAIAAGAPLALTQGAITPRGHAIEARLYAEDPANGYLPSTGTVLAFETPRAPGVRVDAGIAAGDEVSVHYDPMLAKLIVHAEDRPSAVARLRWLLDRVAVLGVTTNTALLRAIAADPDFAAGQTTTAFLDTHDFSAATGASAVPPVALLGAALWEMLSATESQPASGAAPYNPYNPWSHAVGGGGGSTRHFRYSHGTAQYTVALTPASEEGDQARHQATIEGPGAADAADNMTQPLIVAASREGAAGVALTIGERRERCVVARRGYDLLVAYRGQSYTLAKPHPLDLDEAARGGEVAAGEQRLVAPMSGTVVAVHVAEGDRVEAQQTLVVLGAMKMEHAIVAPYRGRIRRVAYSAGEVVPGGAVLIEIESEATSTVESGAAES